MTLDQVRRFALALPEVAEEPHFHYSSFRIRGKIFATVPPEGTHLHIFVDEEDRERTLAVHGHFLEKLYWGKRVSGLRASLPKAQARVIHALLRQAWARKAPKTLLASTDAGSRG